MKKSQKIKSSKNKDEKVFEIMLYAPDRDTAALGLDASKIDFSKVNLKNFNQEFTLLFTQTGINKLRRDFWFAQFMKLKPNPQELSIVFNAMQYHSGLVLRNQTSRLFNKKNLINYEFTDLIEELFKHRNLVNAAEPFVQNYYQTGTPQEKQEKIDALAQFFLNNPPALNNFYIINQLKIFEKIKEHPNYQQAILSNQAIFNFAASQKLSDTYKVFHKASKIADFEKMVSHMPIDFVEINQAEFIKTCISKKIYHPLVAKTIAKKLDVEKNLILFKTFLKNHKKDMLDNFKKQRKTNERLNSIFESFEISDLIVNTRQRKKIKTL